MRENKIKTKLNKGDVVVGTATDFKEPNVVEIIGYSGFDFIMIDMGHQARDMENLENMIRAAEFVNLTPLVRVPEITEAYASRALDMGAMGVVFPHIKTKEDAIRAVKVCKYPPKGVRGFHGYIRATKYGVISRGDHIKTANEETHVWAIIEEAEGVRNISDIVAVEGIDVILLGPADLSVDLGIPGEFDHPLFKEYESKVCAAVKGIKELKLGQFVGNPVQAKEWVKKGCNVIVLSHDSILFTNLYQSTLKQLKELLRS